MVRQVNCVEACHLSRLVGYHFFNQRRKMCTIRTYLARKMIQGIIIRRNIKMDKYTLQSLHKYIKDGGADCEARETGRGVTQT